jgi:hypothetical protein
MCTRAGSNVNATKIHRTPLHIVCDMHADRPHLALLLLAYGARADVRNNNGCTPLDLLLKNWEHGLPVRRVHYRSSLATALQTTSPTYTLQMCLLNTLAYHQRNPASLQQLCGARCRQTLSPAHRLAVLPTHIANALMPDITECCNTCAFV